MSHDRIIAGALAVRSKVPANTAAASVRQPPKATQVRTPPPKTPGTGKSVAKGAGSGALVGAQLGSIVPGVGTAVGAGVGAAAGGSGGARSARRAKKERRQAWVADVGGARKLLVAEFLVCMTILAFSPLTAKHGSEGPVPWMKRAAATCALFFVLALVGAGGRKACRVAAAFGGVVTLALLVSSRDIFAVLAAQFNGSSGGGGGGAGDGGVPDSGAEPPNIDVTPDAPGTIPAGGGGRALPP